MKLSIRQKGLLIVGIPLFFEMLFVGMLMLELAGSRQEARKEAHAVAIVGDLNDIRGRIEDSYAALAHFKNTRKKEFLAKYDDSVIGIQDALKHLRRLAKDDPFDRAEVEKLSKISDTTLSLLSKCRESFVEGNEFASLSNIPVLFTALSSVKSAMDSLSSKYYNASRNQSRGEKLRNERFEYTIYAGVTLNVIAATLIAIFVSKNITGRLQLLKENSRRLANDETLLPAMKTEDEISELDRDFRSMAQQLNLAQQNLIAMTEEAKAGEANIRSIIENMPIGMVLVSENGAIELANPALKKMFGYPGEWFKGKSLEHLLPQSEHGQTKNLATGEFRKDSLTNESMAKTMSGALLHVETSIKKFITTGTGTKQSIVIIQDVTERHEMERLKQEFVAMVSHELRAPLNAVLTILELIVEGSYGEISETGQKRVATAVLNVDRLIALINDLLDIEKMEAGKLTLDLEPVDLEMLIVNSIDSLRTLAESRQISLEYTLSELYALADKNRITQVLINLLSNAIKFSSAGQKVLVELEKNGGMAEIRVIDFGKGIPSKDLGRLFQRFQQVQSPTKSSSKREGTGLGLAISKAIVEQHNGEIGVSSIEDKGSTFYFRIPLHNF